MAGLYPDEGRDARVGVAGRARRVRRRPSLPAHLLTAAGWPVGIGLTSFSYMCRITPLHRRECEGTLQDDGPPPLDDPVDRTDVQGVEGGAGPLLHRTYRSVIRNSDLDAHALMGVLGGDPNRAVPNALARFHKVRGSAGAMAVNDEFVVRMPGPWDGPVRCVHVDPRSLRFATLDGHLEAGQIEWGARDRDDGLLEFRIESWARLGDRLSAFLHDRLPMAKEVQLHMWTSVHERVPRVCGGRLTGGVDIETHRVEI